MISAMATECSAEQGRFWEFHDAIFDNWVEAQTSGFSVTWIRETAESVDLDSAEFEECMQSGRTFERVKASHFDALDRGINSTPTVLVNGKRVVGDYEAFRSAIEDALAETQ